MRFSFPTTWTRCLIGVCLLSLIVTDGALAPTLAQRSRKKSGSARRILSRKEAGAASVRKVQLRRKLTGMGGKIRGVRSKIRAAKVQENRITESLEVVEGRITRVRRSLAQTDARLETLSAGHRATVRRLEATERRLATRRQTLSRRVRYNYERGQSTFIHTLLQSRSMNEMLSRSYYVQRIVQSDTQLILGIRQDIRQIEADKRLLERQQREQQALADELEAQKREYAADMARKQEILQEVHEERAEAEQELDELEEEAEAMTARIRALSEALRLRREALRREEMRRRAAAAAARRRQPRTRRAQPPEPEPELEEVAPVWRGGFIRPCRGPITSGFGYRFHPILRRRKLHTGVDFGAGYGASIRAAAGGTVLMAAYSRGYGNCVILDHGNGVTTLYGHASALLVSEGQVVRQGQTIARVGSTGMSTGPHLHFELRRNGVPVRPF